MQLDEWCIRYMKVFTIYLKPKIACARLVMKKSYYMTGILIIMNVFIHPWTLGNITVKYLSINLNYPWNLSHGRNVASTISVVSNKKCYRLSHCKCSLLDISMQINHAKFLSFLEKLWHFFLPEREFLNPSI